MSDDPLRVAVISVLPVIKAGVEALLAEAPHRVELADRQSTGLDAVIYDLTQRRPATDATLRMLVAGIAPVVALQPQRRNDLGRAALRAGAVVVADVDITAGHLLEVLEQAGRGRRMTEAEWRVRHRARLQAEFPLTERELDVLEGIASGMSNDQISDELHLSVNSIKTYIRNAYKTIGAQTRTQAVLWCVDHGLETRTGQPEGSVHP